MGTASSRYTGFKPKRMPDRRVLSDGEIKALLPLVRIAGTGQGRVHPSSRQDRRHALRKLRLHVKVKTGHKFDYDRQHTPPKFPDRYGLLPAPPCV